MNTTNNAASTMAGTDSQASATSGTSSHRGNGYSFRLLHNIWTNRSQWKRSSGVVVEHIVTILVVWGVIDANTTATSINVTLNTKRLRSRSRRSRAGGGGG